MYICQCIWIESCKSIDDGLKTLTKNIPEFFKLNVLDFNINWIKNENEELVDTLKNNSMIYRDYCPNKYSQWKIKKRIVDNEKDNRKKKSNKEATITSRARRSGEKKAKHVLGELLCCFCCMSDPSENLSAAGTMHASKYKADTCHVKQLTLKLLEMATYLENNKLCHVLI